MSPKVYEIVFFSIVDMYAVCIHAFIYVHKYMVNVYMMYLYVFLFQTMKIPSYLHI